MGAQPQRVMAIGAHPDDIELLCAGTLARYVEQGAHVTMAIATNGDVGSPTLSREEIAEVRAVEARAAADLIGAELILMGFPDEFLFDDRETRLRFIDAIRQADPDVLFVHSPSDYHPDHRNAGTIAIDARIPASVRLVETHYPPARIPHVFLMDTLAAVDFEPEAFVDVTATFETKKRMLLCHESQDAWLRAVYDDLDYEGLVEKQASMRGLQAGCAYAEAFRSLKTYPCTGGPELLPS